MLSNNNNLSANIPSASDIGGIPNPLVDNSSVYYFQPIGGTTLGPTVGGSLAGSNTVSTAITPTGTGYAKYRRARSTSPAAVNTAGAFFTSYTRWFRGAGGGFEALIQFGLSSNVTGHSTFVGLSTNIAALTNTNASSVTNCVGIGFDPTDSSTGTWHIIHNDASGTATKITATNMTRDATSGYNLKISCPSGSSTNITLMATNAITGAVVIPPTTLSTDLPAVDTALAVNVMSHTGATSTATAIDCSKIYITCNY